MNKSPRPSEIANAPAHKLVLLTPKEAASMLKVSLSWLAKARMRGDGPAYVQFGRAVRYSEQTLLHWMNSRRRFSTSAP